MKTTDMYLIIKHVFHVYIVPQTRSTASMLPTLFGVVPRSATIALHG